MTTTISYTVYAGILGDTTHVEGVYDERLSARAYAELVERAICDAYPDADVEVSCDLRVSGGKSERVYGDADHDAIQEHVREIAGRIWEDMDAWLVKRTPEVSTTNGRTATAVAELSDADVARALELIGEDTDDEVREQVHTELATSDPTAADSRAWLAAYAIAWYGRHNAVRVLW